MVVFYEREPARIDLVVAAASAHLQALYECEHVPFVVDPGGERSTAPVY
jgi:hypothetical protein